MTLYPSERDEQRGKDHGQDRLSNRLDRRHRAGPQRLAGAPVCQERPQGRLGGPADRQTGGTSAPRPAPAPMPATPPTRPRWRPCSLRSRPSTARPTWSSTMRVRGARLDRRSAARGRAQGDRDQCLRCLPGLQQAARRMLPQGRGAILLSGATAGVKGFALSATFAMGKFALRGLAQAMARELSPKGIHVAHFVIDGGIRSEAPGARRQARQPARPGRHRRDLLERHAPAPQRLEHGSRGAALGRALS